MKYIKQRIPAALALCLSLFLVGSCNERSTFLDFTEIKPDLSLMDQGDLIRYAYAVQAGLMNKPQNINFLRQADIKLALAEPDLERAEGNARVWQYQSNECILDVYWHAGDTQDNIDHHEFRARQSVSQTGISDHSTPAAWTCMQNFIEGRRAMIEKNLSETYAVLSLNAQRS